jgi:phosphatidylserine/phosphatidylglycerophosphate/cardiolipin synthase-like enzyme
VLENDLICAGGEMSQKILFSHQVATETLNLIGNARQWIVLISPYLKPWPHLNQKIEVACKKKVGISLFTRSDKLEEYMDLCRELSKFGVTVFHVERLHSKIYCNEKECIIASMNLDASSAQNSVEIGFYFDEPNLLADINKYLENLRGIAQPVKTGVLGNLVGSVSRAIADAITKSGHCIRCGERIELNLDYPLCPECYNSWKRRGYPDFTGKHCHVCGRKARTSYDKPRCDPCFFG